MASYYTSDELIKSVKRRAMIPANQSTFQDEDFLAFANEEMSIGLVPTILQLHEDYLMFEERIPMAQGTVRYQIPYRAIGNKLRDVAYRDRNGNVYEMTRITKDDLPYYNGPVSTSRVYAFYIENNEICLVPENITIAGGFLQVTYYMRPNSLVLLSNVGVITNINRTTGEVSLDKIPSNFSTTKLFDMVQINSPHKTLDYDLTATAINPVTKSITFTTTDIPTNLQVGDHICLATESAVPQVPSDLHVVLAHRVAARCLESMGDLENLQAANQKLAEMEAKTPNLIDNRVESAPLKVVNRHSLLRNGLYARRYRFRKG
jgi:hypothetical protein